MQPTLQDNQLMSKHRVLSFKPQLRLEWRGQDGQNETEQPDHSASLGDSITSSTQIRFSVHTTDSKNNDEKSFTDHKPFADLTKPQKKFIEAQRIPYSRVFDASELKTVEYKLAMQEGDYLVAVNVASCQKFGHRIRSQYGHCVQCNTSVLDFQDRKYRK